MTLQSRRLAAIMVPALVAFYAACGSTETGSSSTTGAGGAASGTGGAGTGGDAGATSSTTGSGGEGGVIDPGCKVDTDCVGDPAGAVCQTDTGLCVQCTVASDTCATGEYCNPGTGICVTGCDDASDCVGGDSLFCDMASHLCVGCLLDNDCPQGTICISPPGVCVAGCSSTQPCLPGLSCCGQVCYDLDSDIDHCGSCEKQCDPHENAATTCVSGMCGMGACAGVYADCDGDAATGCEWNTLQDGPCLCTPGETQACYYGYPGTENVGGCVAGTRTCDPSGNAWGLCMGQVLPVTEVCANSIDDDCDGGIDNGADADGDGWTACQGDCCDGNTAACPSPALINPGAYEVLNNGVDDDCNAATSDIVAPVACSAAQKFTGVTGNDVAFAMDLCQLTTANPLTPQQKTWGLITASQLLANGTAASGTALSDIQNYQTAVLQNYGTGGVVPKVGATMGGLSTGRMRDQNDAGYVVPVIGSTYSTSIAFSPLPGAPLGTYLANHGNNLLPGQCGATPCSTGTGANDSVDIALKIRVPTNAQSFSYDFRFFSGEYQSFQCTAYNDYYLAMLTSLAAGIPADHNISFDANNNAVSVNNGFFQVCGGNSKNCGPCPSGTGQLAGTGMDAVSGGGTEWLTTDAPIVSGETMTLELVIFDVNDHIYDSLVLLDNFRWNLTPSTVSTHQ